VAAVVGVAMTTEAMRVNRVSRAGNCL